MAKIRGLDHYVDWAQSTILEVFDSQNKKFLYNLWDEVVLNTPVRTGLAMYSWRLVPTRKNTYKPALKPGEGEIYSDKGRLVGYERVFPEPDRPNLEKYRRKWKTMVLFNNQEYVADLNENENKYYYQFVDDGIHRALAKSRK